MGLLKASGGNFSPTPGVEERASLDHADPAVRRRAVQALAGDAGAVDTLVAMLPQETDNGVRQAAFLALASAKTAAAAQGLAVLLGAADPALRNGALETLATMPEHARDLLDPLGRHADPDVRIFAVLLAGEIHDGDIAQWLIALAQGEADPNVCSCLAEALGGTGAPGAGEALAAIAARFPGDPFLGFAVDTALQRLSEG